MNNNDYIFDFSLEKIQADNGKEIENYIAIREKWIGYYENFGIDYPVTSDNNFRDSWFHYRKIYKERSKDEINRQIANFEEHLQRAERDLVVKFFQDISSCLEKWYLYGLNSQLKPLDGYDELIQLWKRESKCIEHENIIKSGWVDSLYSFCKNYQKSQDDFSQLVLYVFKEYIWNDDVKIEFQKLLHKMKNIVLKIRLGSSEIDRMDRIGQLTQQCTILYEELLEFCNKLLFKEAVILGLE